MQLADYRGKDGEGDTHLLIKIYCKCRPYNT